MDTRGAVDLATCLAGQQDGVLLRSQAAALGVGASSWRHLLAGEWTHVLAGVAYVPAAAMWRATPGPRARGHAALLRAGGLARLCLGSALRLHGIEGTPVGDVEHALLPSSATRRQVRGLALSWRDCPPAFRTDSGGLAAVSTVFAVQEALRRWDREHAVSVLDSALQRQVLAPAALARLRCSPLSPERRAWIDLADRRAESPLETRARLFLGDRGLVGFVPQVTIWLRGHGNVRVDFLRDHLVLETAGRSVHDAATPAARDRRRQEALEAAGFVVVRLTWWDIVHAPDETVRRILRGMATAAARGQLR